ILDCNSIIHRAYHALPPLTTANGEVVNAVYGFLLVFFKALNDFSPDYIAAAFDFPAPSFRQKVFKPYKAKRPSAPPELYSQIPKTKEVLCAFKVPVFEKEGFEADDIIGTVARFAQKQQVLPFLETIIVSGDKDMLQLVDKNTKVYLLRKGVKDIIIYEEKQVRQAFGGLEPRQLLDYKALRGDPSDNIPGVTGIGEKTATELLLSCGDVERLYATLEGRDLACADKIKPKTKELLLRYKEQAMISRQLAAITKDIPLDFKLEDCRWGFYSTEEVYKTLKAMEFSSLLARVPEPKQKE
ncbi:MAG: polymerase protein, partial [Parcubacteria group bacterium GW2011_GWA2_47_9]